MRRGHSGSPCRPTGASECIRGCWLACGLAAACVAILLFAGAASAAALRWSAPTHLSAGIFSMSCPSTHLCVAGTDVGLLVSTDPGGGSSAWVSSAAPPMVRNIGLTVQGVACPSASFCVAVGPDSILTSSDPAGGSGAWKVTRVPVRPHGYLGGVACASASMCVAFESSTRFTPCCSAPRGGRVLTSSDPAGGAQAWKASVLRDVPDGAYCLRSLCLLATEDGDVLLATHPGGAASWRSVHVFGAPGKVFELPTIACASPRYCLLPLGAEFAGIALRSSAPAVRGSWQELLHGFPRAGYPMPRGGSCLPDGFCAFAALIGGYRGAGHGEIYTRTGTGGPWAQQAVPHASAALAVSCVQSICVAGGSTQSSSMGALAGVLLVGRR